VRTGSDQIATGGGHWAETAKSELARKGYRAGGARTAVIEALAEEGGCVEAEQLEQRLAERGSSVGTASVYRALGLLTDLEMLRRVAVAGAPVRYELVHPDGHHHHHIVCNRCGRTVAFTDDTIERAIVEVSRKASFEISDHEITLHGTCENCS
jgi:Fur family ferric uptake transcriptional regulator